MTPFQLFIQLISQTHHYLATLHQPLIHSFLLLLPEATAQPILLPSQRTHFPLPSGKSKLMIHLLNLPTLTQSEGKRRWQFALCAVTFKELFTTIFNSVTGNWTDLRYPSWKCFCPPQREKTHPQNSNLMFFPGFLFPSYPKTFYLSECGPSKKYNHASTSILSFLPKSKEMQERL